jgi:hypothetical protein
MIRIEDGKPKGFTALFWINDYKAHGVMMEQLINPSTKMLGVLFKKGNLRKSIILDIEDVPEDKLFDITREKFLEIEAIFNIPIDSSKYKDPEVFNNDN